MNLRKSILQILLFVCLTVPISIFAQSDTLELPFFEDWSSGSLETNGWLADSNWSINTEMGNTEPSVEFDTRGEDSYFGELTSRVFNGSKLTEGNVWLCFDVKMETNDSVHRAQMDIEVNYGNYKWFNRKRFKVDSGSFDWSPQKIDLTEFAVGHDFQIRFNVSAWDGGVQFWAVDNIHVFRTCPSPYRFSVETIDTLEYDKYRLNFSWQMDEPDQGEWLHWDNGIHAGGVGATYNMTAAARWDAGQLIDYDGLRIKKMRAFLNDDGLDSLIFKIWEGDSADVLIYKDTIHPFEVELWNEHVLKSDIFIDASKELWVGYSIRHQPSGMFPLGYDPGPAVAGYGDMWREDNWDGNEESKDWDRISDFGIDNNWNIQFFVEDPTGNDVQIGQKPSNNRNTNLSGYNLYQSVNGGEYELRNFIPWEYGDTTYSIGIYAGPDLHCFKLTALWASESDTCESAPAIAKDNPDEDFVCVLLVGNEENRIEQSDLVHCYPNPFSNSTTIEYTLQQSATVQISIFNHLGKQVGLIQQNQSVGKQQITWDASGLPTGVYYFRLKAGDQLASGKMVVMR
ncbi:MAG: hypothetical protein DRI89_11730 [Bacteroidetes bacterium]|nr:MAG: hypothetical protein DRI89_11730 [Bacteroidota bacterium]